MLSRLGWRRKNCAEAELALAPPDVMQDFDEGFYTAFYPDIDRAVRAGEVPSGRWHYQRHGWREGRLSKYSTAGALDQRMPGVTAPRLLASATHLQSRLNGIEARTDGTAARTFWLLLPHFNPDIVFGGYIALYEFLARAERFLSVHRIQTKILVTQEDEPNVRYALWHPSMRRFHPMLKSIEVRGLANQQDALTISDRDFFMAYSAWDCYPASSLARHTRQPKILQFVQEYEPIFHDHSAVRAVCEGGFEFDCFPVFNSELLRRYFEANNLGIYKSGRPAPGEFAVFEHVISAPQPDIRERGQRTALVYARPEQHASRNLYEFVEIALRRLIEEGSFGPEWRFIGMGALSDIPPVDLGRGYQLEFKAKMPLDEYKELLSSADIGISLMYAPHPSVVPYELAASGALVVTNTFQNRDANYFSQISANIIACEPRLDSVKDAIAMAVDRAADLESRKRGLYKPKSRSWDEAFHESALAAIFDKFI